MNGMTDPNAAADRFREPPLLSDAGYEITLDDMTIASNADQVRFDGCLTLRADRKSLRRAETLLALLCAYISQVKNLQGLPDEAPPPAVASPVEQPNPFHDPS